MTQMQTPGEISSYAKRSALAAHLFGLGNVVFSLIGIAGAFFIFRVNRNEPFVRANARAAINMQITWLLFAAIVFAIYAVMFLGHGAIVKVEDVETGRLLTEKRYWTALTLFGIILLSMAVTMILNCVGAFQASRGIEFRYPIAIPFVRLKKP